MKTNLTPIPSILKTGDAIGELSVTLNINAQPSFYYTLISKSSLKSRTDNRLKIVINDTAFRIESAVETIDPVTGVHILNVNGEGWYRPILEKEFIVPKGEFSLTNLGRLVGVTISNGGIKKIIKEEYITTLGSEIEEYRNEHGLVVLYKNLNIELVQLGKSGGKSVAQQDLITDVNYNHKKEHVHDYVMLPQYVEVELEDIQPDNDVIQNYPIFETIQQTITTTVNDPDNASTSPVIGEILTLDMNFDMSGERKTKEKTIYMGNTPLTKTITTYGFAYTTNLVASFNKDLIKEFNGFYQNYWRVIENYTITYKYEDGYYIGYDKIGYRLDRFAQETEAFELLSATFNNDLDTQLEAQQYKFRSLPIYEYERLDLEALYNYYTDALPTVDEYFVAYDEYDEDTNQNITKYIRNKAYTVPMFIKRKAMYSRCYDWIPVPPTLAEYVNQIKTCGEERKELYVLNIKESKNTRSSYTDELIGNTPNKKLIDDSYVEYSEVSSAQDADFRNHIQESSSTVVEGRPSVIENTNITQLKEQEPVRNESTRNNINGKYIISAGVTDSSIKPQGSISISGAKTEQEVLRKLQDKINNSRIYSNNEFTLSVFYDKNTKPNYTIRGMVNGQNINGVITSVTHKFNITGDTTRCEAETTINGVEFNNNPIRLDMQREENVPDENEENGNLEMFIPIPYKKENVDHIYALLTNLPKRGKI